MTSRHASDAETARLEPPKYPTLEDLNADYLRNNPHASATEPRPEHTEGEEEIDARAELDELRKARKPNTDAVMAAGQRHVDAMRRRASKGDPAPE